MSLSVQLADARREAMQMSAALEAARAHLQAQQAVVAARESETSGLGCELEAAQAALRKERAAAQELRRILDALRPKAGALAEERDALRQALEMERTAAIEAQERGRRLQRRVRHHESVEAALRGELRRVLAGSPSPLKTHAPLQCGRAAAALLAASGSGGHTARNQQQQLKTAASPVHRLGRQQQLGSSLESSPGNASLSEQYHLLGSHSSGSEAHDGSSGSGGEPLLIPAKPSPTKALLHLQQQQGSRLGERREDNRAAGLGLASPPSSGGKSAQQRHQQQMPLDMLPLALPPGPTWQHSEQQQQPIVTVATAAPAQPPPATTLDKEIAALEADLASLVESHSPITQIQAAARKAIAAGDTARLLAWGSTDGGKKGGKAAVATCMVHNALELNGAIGAWRPNAVYQQNVGPSAPDAAGRTAAAQPCAGQDALPWRHNPLASGSPSPAKPMALVAEQPSEWQWQAAGDAVQQVQQAVSAATNSASSPSLKWSSRHASSTGGQQDQPHLADPHGSSVSLAAGMAPADTLEGSQQPQRQRPVPLVLSQAGSQGGGPVASEGAPPSLSRQWSLPSAGASGSDWLSSLAGVEGELQELEVNSGLRPSARSRLEVTAGAEAVGAVGTQQHMQQQQQADWAELLDENDPKLAADESGSSGGGWAKGWQSAEAAAQREAAPLLPGRAVVEQPRALEQQQQLAGNAAPSPQGTLFDLAALDINF